jgi:hypothetical protein
MLNDKGKDKRYLISEIKEHQKNNQLTKRPTLLIDAEVFTYNELRKAKIKISKVDISSIYVVPMATEDISNAIQIITKTYQNSQEEKKNLK